MSHEVTSGTRASAPAAIAALAARLRVDPSELCLIDELSVIVRAFVREPSVVALAEPTDSSVTTAVVAAGVRYVDVGRTADMRVHPDGWAFAMASPATTLGWLLSPDEPTATTPSRALFKAAEAVGVPVVLDERFSYRPGAPALLSGAVIRLRALTWEPPAGPGLVVALAPAELLIPIRRLARARVVPPVPPRRVAAATDQPLPLPAGAVVVGRTPLATCFRIPGRASAEIAGGLGLPTAGSSHWSWRDTARVWAWDRTALEEALQR